MAALQAAHQQAATSLAAANEAAATELMVSKELAEAAQQQLLHQLSMSSEGWQQQRGELAAALAAAQAEAAASNARIQQLLAEVEQRQQESARAKVCGPGTRFHCRCLASAMCACWTALAAIDVLNNWGPSNGHLL